VIARQKLVIFRQRRVSTFRHQFLKTHKKIGSGLRRTGAISQSPTGNAKLRSEGTSFSQAMLSLLRIAEGQWCGLTAPKGGPSRGVDFPKMDIVFGRGTSACALAQERGVGGRKGRGPAQEQDPKTCKPDLVTCILHERLLHPIHRRMRSVLDLYPMLKPTGLIRAVPITRTTPHRCR
jgi:hypothetical protein